MSNKICILEKSKSAQVSLFIMLGIILLITVGSLLYYIHSTKVPLQKEEYVPLEFAGVKSYVERCIMTTAASGVYYLSDNGGYIYSYDNVLYTEKKHIAYSLKDGILTSPSNSFMEEQLSRFIENSLPACLDNFKSFPNYKFEPGQIKATTNINLDDVTFTLNYPIKIQSAGNTFTLSDYRSSVPIRLGRVLSVRDNIISNISQTDYLDLAYLSSTGMNIAILPLDINNMVFHIYDKESDFDGHAFEFYSAVRKPYYGAPLPVILTEKYHQAFVNNSFYLKINATSPKGDPLMFEDDTTLFDIDPATGEIRFTPRKSMIGIYEVTITANDGINKGAKKMSFEVIDNG